MDKRKIESLVKRIDKALEELAKATGGNHISAFICNNGICIDDYTENHETFSYYRGLENEQGNFEW